MEVRASRHGLYEETVNSGCTFEVWYQKLRMSLKGSAQEQDSPKDDDPLLYERLLPLLEAWDEIPQQEQRRL